MNALIPDLFSSKSRTTLLLLLEDLSDEANLSELAELSRGSLCATQSTLRQLLDEGWVQRRRAGKETQYRLNRKHRNAWVLSSVAQSLREAAVRRRAEGYAEKARRSLEFASNTGAFLKDVRARNVES